MTQQPPQGSYPPPSQQPRPGQYPPQGQYPAPGQYPTPGQYAAPGQYPTPGQYPPPGQFPEANQWGAWQQGPTQPQPPVIPFRPLNLGDLISGTFAAIRSNPQVMFVFSIVTMTAVGLVGGVMNALVFRGLPSWNSLPYVDDAQWQIYFGTDFSMLMPTLLPQGVVSVLQAVATLLIAGMLVIAVTNAVIAANRDLQGTWDQLRPRFWPLVGTSLLVALIAGAAPAAALAIFGLLGWLSIIGTVATPGLAVGGALLLIIASIVATVWLSVRLFFATMVVVVERVGVTEALRRSWTLTHGAFWRCFGRLLLMGLVVGAASSILSGIVSGVTVLVTGFAPPWVTAWIVTILMAAISGLVQPVSASYTSLMYVDERIRKEGLGPTLQVALDENLGREAAARPPMPGHPQ